MSKTYKHAHLLKQMEQLAPTYLAYEWDNVGLQIGNKNDDTKNVLITLDVTEEVVDEAIENNVNLIIAHHPLLFQSLKKIDTTSFKGKIIEKIIKHNITVYAAHTNLDIATGGVNDMICQQLEITQTKPLLPTYRENLYKLIVFVPQSHEVQLIEALGNAGAGSIGNYSHCAFISEGTGTFRPNEEASPYLGEIGSQHKEKEARVEVIVTEQKLAAVKQAFIQTHPYEEPAFDIILLENQVEALGLGRIGTIHHKPTVTDLCNDIKEQFQLSHVRIIGERDKSVHKVAVVGGSGEKFIDIARKANADVYITGDMTFHAAQDAQAAGMTIIDAGHIIEKIMVKYTANYLQAYFPNGIIKQSNINTNPFQYY